MAMNNYYYNQQISKYIVQFMSIFEGLTVMVPDSVNGGKKPIEVPVQYGSKDRVAAAILTDNTQNKMVRLPVMSAYLGGISLAPQRRKGTGLTRQVPHVPRGGIFPNDVKMVHQYMPIPYDTVMQLSIYTSNMNTHFQILEQLFMLFDPVLQIQMTDDVFDWTKITMVELADINFEENYPAGTEKRMIVSTISFNVPIYISAPANLKKDFVKDIYVRIGALDSFGDGSSDIMDMLDEQGLNYELMVSASDIPAE